jgi:hypothetical protein
MKDSILASFTELVKAKIAVQNKNRGREPNVSTSQETPESAERVPETPHQDGDSSKDPKSLATAGSAGRGSKSSSNPLPLPATGPSIWKQGVKRGRHSTGAESTAVGQVKVPKKSTESAAPASFDVRTNLGVDSNAPVTGETQSTALQKGKGKAKATLLAEQIPDPAAQTSLGGYGSHPMSDVSDVHTNPGMDADASTAGETHSPASQKGKGRAKATPLAEQVPGPVIHTALGRHASSPIAELMGPFAEAPVVQEILLMHPNPPADKLLHLRRILAVNAEARTSIEALAKTLAVDG